MESRSQLSSGLAALSAALVAVVLSAWPALAVAPAVAARPALTPSAQMVQAGGQVTINGSGFTQCTDSAGNTVVDVSANGTVLVAANGSSGDFQQAITIPAGTSTGPYFVTAECPAQPSTNLASTNVSVVTLTLSPSSGTPSTTISVSGSGFIWCDDVQLQLLRHQVQPQLLQDAPQTVATDSPVLATNGNFSAGLPVPSSAAPGNGYEVGAGCYPAAGGNALVAAEPFTVTSAGTSVIPSSASASPTPTSSAGSAAGSPSQASASPTPTSSAGSAAGSPSSASASSPVSSTSPSSPGSPSPSPALSAQPSGRASGLLQPVALVGGTSAGLALVALLLVRALSMVHGRRGRGWVNKHLRVAAGWGRPLSARVERRRGAMSVSVGFEPHFDGLRNTQNEEAAR
jgi:hypothetical protein